MTEPINLCLGYEQRTLDSLTRPFTLPVTLITGFLGSGKTTLLRSLLAQKRNLRIATLINDLGEFNHDVQLLELVTTTTADSSSLKHHPLSHQPASDRVMDLHGNCLCCSNLQQKMRQNVWECLQTPDGEARAVDYLVIETSGVTDPETLIRALDEKFGKMTRARLDSVVTVVDADVLYSELTPLTDRAMNAAADADSSVVGRGGAPAQPPLMSTARRHQLEYADVIILNKIDLLQDQSQLETVEARLRSLNPLARIHRTRYAEVPLPCVLDVELPDVGIGQMTHETGAANFSTRKASTLRSHASHNVSTRGKADSLLTGSAAAASLVSADKSSMTHLITDGLCAFTFQSARPFLLNKLQRFFSHVFPAEAVVRCKGFMHVRDLPGRRVTLSMSGRRRFHVSDEGPWQSAPKTQLVFIGHESGFDKAVIEVALEEACADSGGNVEKGGDDDASASAQLAAKVRALVAQDKRMELVDPHSLLAPLLFPRVETNTEESKLSLPMWVNCLVAFRLTGAPSLGVTSEHLRLTHGVDLNAMSRALQAKINMASAIGIPLLYTLPFGRGGGDVALCFVVDEGEEAEGRGETYFIKTWEWMVSAAAESVISSFLGHLKLCKCGH